MSRIIFEEKMQETANAIKSKLGINTKMKVEQFPVNIDNIEIATSMPDVLDPLEVYNQQRDSSWMKMPTPLGNEIYMLFMIPSGLRSLISFQVTAAPGSKYTVSLGKTDENGTFISSKTPVQILSGSLYENELYGPDFSDNPLTTNGMRQIMIKISGTGILSFLPTPHTAKGDDNRSGWNIFEISCNIPNCTSFKCGNQALTRALRNLVWFRKYGVSSITDFSYMFSFCNNLKAVIGIVGTDSITNCQNMFNGCTNLIAISNFNMKNSTNASHMFDNCNNLVRIPELDFGKVYKGAALFQNCSSLVYLENLDFSSLYLASYMFNGCNNLLELSNCSFPQKVYGPSIFKDCWKITQIPSMQFNGPPKNDSGENVGPVVMNSLFENCYSLVNVEELDLTDIYVGSNMFKNCKKIENISITGTFSAYTLTSMFEGCVNLKYITPFTTNGNKNNMFKNCYSIEQDLSFATVGSSQYMSNMFENCKSITTIDLKDNSGCQYANEIFKGCSSLLSITNFTLNKMEYTNAFENCYSLGKFTSKSNGSPPYGSGSKVLNFSDCVLGYQAIIDMFNSLPQNTNASTSFTVTIKLTGNRGVGSLTASDKKIATDKGYLLEL